MCFVRKARDYEEQNLVVNEEGGALYFTTTKSILPKQELKVGYSTSYAQQYKLPVLEPKEEVWPCYECSEKFTTSDAFQKHLNTHEERTKDENHKPRSPKRALKFLRKKSKLKKPTNSIVECNICNSIFSQYNYSGLKKHLSDAHSINGSKSVEESFSIVTLVLFSVTKNGNYYKIVCISGISIATFVRWVSNRRPYLESTS